MGSAGYRKTRLCFAGLLCLVAIVAQFHAQEPKRITFYTPQTAYTLPVVDRNGAEYVGLLEALEPLGSVSAKADGRKWKLNFRDMEAQFEAGKPKARIRGKNVTLPAPFLLESARGYISVSSLKEVLQQFLSQPVEVKEAARRVYISMPPTTFSGRKIETGKVSFTFSAPVTPSIQTESGKLRINFTRDPVEGQVKQFTFDDKYLPSATYSEGNGGAELTLASSVPLVASISPDRKSVTISAVAPAPALAQTPPQQPPQTGAATKQPAPRAKSNPVVLIDAAHGGADNGATLADKLLEKDVTLSFARRLQRDLQARGIDTALLRDGDIALTPEQRILIANSSGTALYLCIHASNSGTGVHVFSAMTSAKAHKPLAFIPVGATQDYFVASSRTVAAAVSAELLKRDFPGVPLAAAVPPLDSIAAPALAIEIGIPPQGRAKNLASSEYQQSIASAIANAIATVRGRLPQGGSQ